MRSRTPGSPGTANPRAASNGRTSRTARVTVERSTQYSAASADVRELGAQRHDQGDDDPVGERKLVIGAGAGRALAFVAAAIEQP